jgi:hypothetical protein
LLDYSSYLYLHSTSAPNWWPGAAHENFKIGSINIIKIKNPSNAWLASAYPGSPSIYSGFWLRLLRFSTLFKLFWIVRISATGFHQED